MKIVTLESELKQARFALTEIKVSLLFCNPLINIFAGEQRSRCKETSIRARHGHEAQTGTQEIISGGLKEHLKALEQESQLRKRKIEELNGDLTQMRDSNMKAARTEASKQRMSLEEEAQKLREAMRDLEDKF